MAKTIAGLAVARTGCVRLEAAGTGHGGAGGLDLLSASAVRSRAARRAVHLVMQDPYASLPPHMRVLDIVAEPLVIHRIGHRRARGEAARDALRAVGIDPDDHGRRMPHELSGGERQRVAFARAIVTRPEVILADEPTGMLDATLRAEVSDLMGALSRDHGTAILHITHDLALAARTCVRIVVMADGGVVEQGRTRVVLQDPQHETTQRLLAAALRGARAVTASRRVRGTAA